MQPPNERINLLLADDDERFRRMVEVVLACEDDIHIVSHARNGVAAVLEAEHLAPDVVLLDVRMPGRSGIDAARAIHRAMPTTKIVMLTASDEEDDVFEALKAGASGYILKGESLVDLAGVIRAMARNLGLLLSPSIAGKLLAEFRSPPWREGNPSLSDRELEVLTLVGRGLTNDQIAEDLYLSSHTVKRHVANILAKLHERTRLKAVAHAIRAGILSAGPAGSVTT